MHVFKYCYVRVSKPFLEIAKGQNCIPLVEETNLCYNKKLIASKFHKTMPEKRLELQRMPKTQFRTLTAVSDRWYR